MTTTGTEAPVHIAGRKSREAAVAKRKQDWLDLFADDAVVADPIGPSYLDPEGNGHHGLEAISAFYDKTIGAVDSLEFVFADTFICGDEEANTGYLVTTQGGYRVRTDGVFTYKVNAEGKLVALRAYWEMERSAASAQKI